MALSRKRARELGKKSGEARRKKAAQQQKRAARRQQPDYLQEEYPTVIHALELWPELLDPSWANAWRPRHEAHMLWSSRPGVPS